MGRKNIVGAGSTGAAADGAVHAFADGRLRAGSAPLTLVSLAGTRHLPG
jgi:hypothetical protein